MTLPNKPVRIPIRQLGAADGGERGRTKVAEPEREEEVSRVAEVGASEVPETAASQERAQTEPQIDWKNKALRLQAEMQTYRQRQQRWAQEKVIQEKAELLSRFLEVADNLEQALKHIDPEDPAHQGVQMAYDSMLRMLIREDVERIFAKGREFDPDVHEAVAAVPAKPGQRGDMRVAEVVRPGYRYKDRVLRPAKVVVAK